MVFRPLVSSLQGDADAAARQFISQFGGKNLSLVLIFATEGGAVGPLTSRLHQALGRSCLVLGCSSAGGFAFDGYDDDSIIAVAFPAGAFRAEAIWLSNLRQHMALDWMVALRGLDESFRPAPGRSAFGLLLIDGMSGREELGRGFTDSGRTNIISCSRGLPGDSASCVGASDRRGAGLAIGSD